VFWSSVRAYSAMERLIGHVLPIVDEEWELFTNIFARLLMGWDSPDATPLAALYRACHSPESFRKAHAALLPGSQQAYTSKIQVPTLLLHPLDDQAAITNIRRLASDIANAQVIGIPGETVAAWPNAIGIGAILDFINSRPRTPGGPIPAPELDTSAIKTIFFTDIEAHTAMMQRLGDDNGRAVLRAHDRITREALHTYGGAEIKTIGDSFMASFASAHRALECAIALQEAFESQEVAGERLRIRVGVNAGEPIAEENDLFGSSVILAARTKEKAKGGEILITDVVRQLVIGKGFLFAERGEMEMRGFDDPVRVYEVRWQ